MTRKNIFNMKQMVVSLFLSLLVLSSLTLTGCKNQPPISTDTENVTSRDTSAPQTKQWTVTFDTDGGSQIQSQQVDDGARVQKPDTPQKDGYTFFAWTCFDEAWSFVNNAVTENLTLKAVWMPNTYSISAKGANGTVPLTNVTFGSNYSLRVPSKEGYTFKGYTLNGVPFPMNGAFTHPNNLTLEEQWEIITYKATFVAFGKKVGETTFTVNDRSLKNVPEVTQNGLPVAWNYTLEYKDITITSDTVYFGQYEQDPNKSGAEQIEWYILDSQDGKTLLLSKYGLDNTLYSETFAPTTWETSNARKWLNESFYSTAFSSIEKTKIAKTLVTADKSPINDIDSGNDTEDNVFLLSAVEVNKYLTNDQRKGCIVTDFAASNKAHRTYNSNLGWWYTRTPGRDQRYNLAVFDSGEFYAFSEINSKFYVLRPAIWVVEQ